jgi:hypothetical protein
MQIINRVEGDITLRQLAFEFETIKSAEAKRLAK